ncbi:RNA-directed DNA polymerase, eukaryota, partial [Tanacetum coccineum]
MEDNKSHGNIDGGEWVYVQRKQRSKGFKTSNININRDNKVESNGFGRRLSDFDNVMREKATSFYFSNFPDSGDTNALWKMFNHYGLKRMSEKTMGCNLDKDKVNDKILQLDVDESLKKRLMNTWVGKAKNVDVLQNIWYILKKNGLEEGKVKYLGGLSFMVEWNSKYSASTSLQENLMWLNQWFDDLKMWKDSFIVSERLAWIKLDSILVLVLTPLDMDVNRTLKVKVNGVVPSIKVPQNFVVVEDDKDITRIEDLVFSDGTDTETPMNFEKGGENHHSSCMEKEELAASPIPMKNAWAQILKWFLILNWGSVGDMDKELDDLMLRFQRISDMAYQLSKGTSLKRKSKNKKKNLVFGDTSISSSFMSAGNCVDFSFEPDVIRKRFGESIGFVYDNGTKAFWNPPEVKKGWIQRIALSEKPMFFGVQETKMEFIDSFLVKSIWHRPNDDFSFASSTGASGGILSMWDDNIFSKEQEFMGSNFLGTLGSWVGISSKVALLNVYGPQDTSLKETLWNCIEGIITSNPAIWIVFGDF